LNILRFDELDSTQDEAKRQLPKLHEWDIVVAKTQTKGRGKPGSVWHSPVGGLYFSLIVKPTKDINDLLFITKTTADVVVSILSDYKIDAKIKLPNDVMVENKKICGILIEKSKDSLIIGVGLNVNNKDFPNDLSATSLNLLIGRQFVLDEILSKFLSAFSLEYSKIV